MPRSKEPKGSAQQTPVPEILQVQPEAAIPGGELKIRGRNFSVAAHPKVLLGDAEARLVIGSDDLVIAKVPDQPSSGEVTITSGVLASAPYSCEIGIALADGLHPVGNPAVDRFSNIYTTLSGSRGQKTPVSVYRIEKHEGSKPFLSEIMNAHGLAFDRAGLLYISSRNDGVVYRATPRGEMTTFVQGMGVATGIAFDKYENLYVGDRSGTIFKVSPEQEVYVFATLEPSVAAYHLTFGPDGYLYVTGPTTTSFDSVVRIDPDGQVETYLRGLGRPQGLAFDAEGNLYVAASHAGRRGIVRINPEREPSIYVSGPGIVGLAFTPNRALAVATTNTLYRVAVGVAGFDVFA